MYFDSLSSISALAADDINEEDERAKARACGRLREYKQLKVKWTVVTDTSWSPSILARVLSFMGDGHGVHCKHPAKLTYLFATSKRFCRLVKQIIDAGVATPASTSARRNEFDEANEVFDINAGPSRVGVIIGSHHLATYIAQSTYGSEVQFDFNGVSHNALWTGRRDSCMERGDRVCVEVSNTSGGSDNLQVCTSRSLQFYDDADATPLTVFGVMTTQTKVCVLTVDHLLGFEDTVRGRFVARPYAHEFLRIMSRDYILCVCTDRPGRALFCGLFYEYPLLFLCENAEKPTIENMSETYDVSWVNSRNCLMIDTVGREYDQNNTILIDTYERRNKRDVILNDPCLLSTLHDISNCVDVGVFISEYNE